MFRKLWEKVKAFFRWILDECRDWRTVVLLIAVVAAVYSPVWVGYLLKLIFGWQWAAVMATAVLVFWAGPFYPVLSRLRRPDAGNQKMVGEAEEEIAVCAIGRFYAVF